MAQDQETKLNKRFDQNIEITGTLTVGEVVVSPSSYLTQTEGDARYIQSIPSEYLTQTEGDARYLQSFTVPSEYLTQTEGDARYLQSYSESDTLATVTSRGSSTTAGITVNGTISLPQNPVGTTYGNGVSTVPSYMFTQGAGDNDGIRIYAEAGVTNDVRFIFEVIDDLEAGDTWVFRNKRTYTDYAANEVVKISGAGDITANTFVKSGGSSSQFLKADGSVDSNTYITGYTETDTLATVTARGNTTSTNITAANLYSNGRLYINSSAPIIELKDIDSTGAAINSFISYKDSGGNERGWVGYGSGTNTDFGIQNTIGSIRLYAPVVTNGGVRVSGTLEIDASSAINLYGNGSGTYNRSTVYVDSTIASWEAPLATDSSSAARTPFVFTWRGGYASKGGLTLAGGLQLYTTDTGLGIDTSTPLAPIHTKRTNSGYGAFFENSQGGTGNYVDVGFSTYSVTQTGWDNAGATIRVIDNGAFGGHFTIRTKGNGIGAADAEMFRIDANNGHIGINRDTPENQLTVRGTNALVDVQSTADGQTIGFLARYQNNATLGARFIYTTGDAQAYIDNLFAGNNGVYSDITFRNCTTSGTLTERLKIKGSTGDVIINSSLGIGITPTEKLDVNGSSYFRSTMGIANGQQFRLAGISDGNHFLRKIGTGYSGVTVDGPQLQGHQGGELATNYTGDNWALRWAIGGNVVINNNLTTGGSLYLINTNTRISSDGSGEVGINYGSGNTSTYSLSIYNSTTRAIGLGRTGDAYFSGKAGIGTTVRTDSTLTVANVWRFGTNGIFYWGSSYGQGYLSWDTAYASVGSQGSADLALLSGTSRVGVLTTDPAAVALDINGSAAIRGANYLYFGHDGNNIGGWETRQYASGGTHKFNASSFEFNRDGYESNSTSLKIDTSKRVIIGTTSTSHDTGATIYNAGQYALVVEQNRSNGSADFDDALFVLNNNQGDDRWSSIGFSTYGTDGQHHRAQIRAYKGGGTYEGQLRFFLRQSGTAAMTEKFRMDYVGNFYAAADIIAYHSYSDKRLKTKIKPLKNSLEKINKLQGVEYEWKKGPRVGKKQVGLIAQEVEKVLPEVVRTQARFDEEKEYKTVDYENIVGVLIEAIKELTNKVEELENKLNGTK